MTCWHGICSIKMMIDGASNVPLMSKWERQNLINVNHDKQWQYWFSSRKFYFIQTVFGGNKVMHIT